MSNYSFEYHIDKVTDNPRLKEDIYKLRDYLLNLDFNITEKICKSYIKYFFANKGFLAVEYHKKKIKTYLVLDKENRLKYSKYGDDLSDSNSNFGRFRYRYTLTDKKDLSILKNLIDISINDIKNTNL